MILDEIIKLKQSKSYIDYQNYHRNNIFTLSGTSRQEAMHSNFLKWLFLLNIKNGSVSYPVTQLVNMIYSFSEKEQNSSAQINKLLKYNFLDEKYITDVKVSREIYSGNKKHKRYIDILIELTLKDGFILPIIIENKVNSKEHDDQTADYYMWGEKTYSDKSKYYTPIYLFLTPEYNKDKANTPQFFNVKYQDLVDYVIEPTLWNVIGSKEETIIRSYLECLSYQFDDEKGNGAMAITKEEKMIIEKFIGENRTLINSILMSLKDELDEEVIKQVEESVNNYSTYTFNGIYCSGKGNLVLNVVKYFVSNNPNVTFDELKKAFPDTLLGAPKVVEREADVSDLNKGLVPGKDGKKHKRFFTEEPIKVKDGSGEVNVLVTSQWGAGNIDKFITKVVEMHGYVIVVNN